MMHAIPTPPPAIVAQVPATPPPCAFPTSVVAFGVDQSQTVTVDVGQSFILAMRGAGGESYLLPYTMRSTPGGPTATYVRAFTLSDVTFVNADRAPGTPMLADGGVTQYFLFHATGVGTTTVTFDEFAIGHAATPYASKTFTIVVTLPSFVC